MSKSRDLILAVRWNIVFLLIAILISTALYLFSAESLKAARQNHQVARVTADDSRRKADQLNTEENLLRSQIARYQALEARGIIGEEKRLDWIDLLRSIKEERKLLSIAYEVSPQQTLADNQPTNRSAGHQLLSSSMRVHLAMLTETDLLNLVSDLQTRAASFVRLQECAITKNKAAATDKAGNEGTLQADCKLDWITIKELGK